MAFMQPVVFYDEYFDCETRIGREIVPIDLVKRPENLAVGQIICPEDDPEFTDVFEDVSQFVEGTIDSLELKSGWLARMSAPGYTDCTDWTAHKTAEEAHEYLKEMYGDDDE